jgi:hypothetical protein
MEGGERAVERGSEKKERDGGTRNVRREGG